MPFVPFPNPISVVVPRDRMRRPSKTAAYVPENDDTPESEERARAELQLQYGLKLYDDSLARYRALDAKAARSLPTYALILTLMGFLPTQLDSYTLPTHFLWTIGAVFAAGLLCAIAGMTSLVRAMATQPTAALPNDDRTTSAFQSADASRLSQDVAQRAHKAACAIDQESDKKAKAVKCGLQLWIPTMSLLLLSVLLMVTLGYVLPSATAKFELHQPTELPTVTDNRERNDNTDDQETTGNEPEHADDQDTDDGNVLGPLRYLSESREQPVVPTDKDKDNEP